MVVYVTVTALAPCLAPAAEAPSCRAGAAANGNRVVVAELFTSEGCESCPPAERFFSALRADSDMVPLVWHVDYFDRLGWKDRFAIPQATQRQRLLLHGKTSTVAYTPQVFVAGAVYTDWRDSRAFRTKVLRSHLRTGDESIALDRIEVLGDRVGFELAARGIRGSWIAQVALVSGGLMSRVTAGENKGLTLLHEHVVRDAYGPLIVDATSGVRQGSVKLPSVMPDRRFRLVAWLQDADSRIVDATWVDCTS